MASSFFCVRVSATPAESASIRSHFVSTLDFQTMLGICSNPW